ncbi:MAG: hypothetical protein RLZZ410_1604 [Pseudomonadota bacterium]|jgi:hypothetical protein
MNNNSSINNPYYQESLEVLQGYREAEFLSIKAYSDHPEVYKSAEILVAEFSKTRSQVRNKEKYLRDAKKLIASIWLHQGQFRFTTKDIYFSKGKRKQVWMTNRTLDLFNCAKDLGWIELIVGAIPPYLAKNKIGFSAIYQATEKFKKLLSWLTIEAITVNPDLPCVVRKDEDKRVIEEPESFYQTLRYREHQNLVQSHLKRLEEHQIRWANATLIPPSELLLTRQFTQTFGKGGRWYCNFQNKPKTVRNSITIGGKPVGSLDITQCHPMLILRVYRGKENELGLFTNSSEDVYEVKGFEYLDRNIRKKVINTLFNAKSEKSAEKSLRNTHWWLDELTGELEIKTYKTKTTRRGKPVFRDSSEIKAFINQFQFQHPDFINAIGTGIGLLLQGFDGAITTQVLKFADLMKLPIIPIHEEFIVPEDKKYLIEEILKQSMRVVLMEAGQYGTLKAKWTDSKGEKSDVILNLENTAP